MKKALSIIIIAVLLLTLTACSGNPLVEDLKTYPGVIRQIVIQEIAFEKAFSDMKARLKDQPEPALALIKATLIPSSQIMITTMENGTPQTEALVKVHTLLKDAIQKRHNALTALQGAIESKEVATIKSALATLEETIEGFNKQFVEVNKTLESLKAQ
jgi:flagellar motility protein MotE (MotC chaperone)